MVHKNVTTIVGCGTQMTVMMHTTRSVGEY